MTICDICKTNSGRSLVVQINTAINQAEVIRFDGCEQCERVLRNVIETKIGKVFRGINEPEPPLDR